MGISKGCIRRERIGCIVFNINISQPVSTFDDIVYTRALQEEVRVQVRQAAKQWLLAAGKKIPIETGEARGTLLPLARFLRVTASVPIDGAEPVSYRGQTKGPSSGSSSEKQLVFDFLSNRQGEFFTISIQLFHYWWNEFYEHNYPNQQVDTPWMSLADGGEAFITYIETEGIRKVPRIEAFRLVSMIDVKGTNKFKAPTNRKAYTQ